MYYKGKVLLQRIIEKGRNFLFSNYYSLVFTQKATKFCEISYVVLTGTTQDKSTIEILQNFVAFSEYMNFAEMGNEEVI